MTTSTSTMTDRRFPTHLAVLVGISAGAYAVSVAGVAALQAHADTRLSAERAPFGQAADAAAADHDALEAAVEAAARRYLVLAGRYDRLGGQVTTLEAGLDALAARAAALTESTTSLPTRFSLPTIRSAPRVVAAPRTSAPKTSATTGASG
jgi:hypothetical protein